MENNKLNDKIDELVESLNRASRAYYNGADEIMPNYEWDAMFDELTQLEKETGYIRQDSPTQNAGYEAESGNREPHEYPALSLAKTKLVSEILKIIKVKEDSLLVYPLCEDCIQTVQSVGQGSLFKPSTFMVL